MIGFNGGLIGAARNTSTSTSVPGVWTLNEQVIARKRKEWVVGDNFDKVSLLLHGNGPNGSTSFIDSGPGGLPVTTTGTPVISTAQSKFGGSSMFFEGTASALYINAITPFVFTGDFTVEAWIYKQGSGEYTISALWTGNDPTICSYIFRVSPGGYLQLVYGIAELNPLVSGTTRIVATNVWTHVAVTRAGSTVRFFVNGNLDGSTHTVSGALNTATSTGTVGVTNQQDGGWFLGYIDDLRITKGLARYTTTFTPPATAFVDSSSGL